MRCFFSHCRWLALLVILVTTGAGCTRKFFRKRTDDDVVGVLTQKNQHPEWGIENWHIYPDPRARYADPSNPDRPPKPPDDPAAYLLSPDPQPSRHKRGLYEGSIYLKYIEEWDAENRAKQECRAATTRGQAPAAESDTGTGIIESFDRALVSQDKTYLIDLQQSSELSLFNSREYMDRREDLYGAALPVTLQRFAFAAQFFGTTTAIREVSGSQTPQGAGSRWRLNSTGGVSKLFPSGALLMAQLANKLVVEFGQNARPTISMSNLTLSLTQPLLRGGGFAVTMEPLTQAERSLLYAIRSYARFRKIYYTYIAGGNNNIFNAPYSYAGLSLRGVGPTLTAPGQGYFPTVLLDILKKNESENINNLERYWKIFQAYEEGGDVSRLQVDQVEQQLLRSRSSLLQRRVDLGNGLDQFKIQLGLPTPLPLELDDSSLHPLQEHLARFNRARDDFDDARRVAENFAEAIRRPAEILGGGLLGSVPVDIPLRDRLRTLFSNSPAVRGTKFGESISARWQRWEKMEDDGIRNELKALADQQRELLDRKARTETNGQKLSAEDEARITALRADINLGKFEMTVRNYERKPWLKEPGARMAREQSASFRVAINYFNLVLGEAREERLAKVRDSWPTLPPSMIDGVDLLKDDLDRTQTVTAQMALTNRLELMNARGQLVDSWRQIAVTANSLLGIVNVGYNLTSASTDTQPLNIGGSRSVNQLVINGELPLVRRAERNNYRTSLIAYQRQRRTLQASEDFILNDVRTDLRQIRLLAENYRIQQRSVEVAYAQVENSLEALQAPPDPRNVGGGQSAGSAAALTQQLLNAQSSLLQAQNTLYTVWINYLIARMQLYRDLELLPLDPRGVWTDEYFSPTEPQSGSCDVQSSCDAVGIGDHAYSGTQSRREGIVERLPEPEPLPRIPPASAVGDRPRPNGTSGEPQWQRTRP